nr:MAG TPA: hypothetical protein [Caudoviricetes sp.]
MTAFLVQQNTFPTICLSQAQNALKTPIHAFLPKQPKTIFQAVF